jgi:hypothetical protein
LRTGKRSSGDSVAVQVRTGRAYATRRLSDCSKGCSETAVACSPLCGRDTGCQTLIA